LNMGLRPEAQLRCVLCSYATRKRSILNVPSPPCTWWLWSPTFPNSPGDFPASKIQPGKESLRKKSRKNLPRYFWPWSLLRGEAERGREKRRRGCRRYPREIPPEYFKAFSVPFRASWRYYRRVKIFIAPVHFSLR